MSDRSDDVSELLASGEDDELWLLSYSDLLTLLLGFFVLLVAASPMKTSRFEQLAASLTGSAPPLEELKERVDALVESAGLSDQVRTRESQDGLEIELRDALLFDSGSAEVRAQGRQVVTGVARLLRDLPGRAVVVEGHTDDVPIHTPLFRSNWELSSQRAINVLLDLEADGVERTRLSARGYADTRPLPGEGSPDARRAANRRVVIRVE